MFQPLSSLILGISCLISAKTGQTLSVIIKQFWCPHCIHRVFLILICSDFIRWYCVIKSSFSVFGRKNNTCRFLHQQVLSDNFLIAESQIFAGELFVSQADFSDSFVNSTMRFVAELFCNFLKRYALHTHVEDLFVRFAEQC